MSEPKLYCDWCARVGKLYPVGRATLCKVCAAEYYDMVDEELYDFFDEEEKEDDKE